MVSSELIELLAALQSLESLSSFALAGGTNLSIRYNHRESIDIDLFSSQCLGIAGLHSIEKEIRDRFKENVLSLNIEDPDCGEQYCFIKSLIRKGALTIKVEILQNIQVLYPVELINNLRLISRADIGMMKLESLSTRKAQKDVYDLDVITDEISLQDLLSNLKVKKEKFKEVQHKSLFDLDEKVDPIENPLLLLSFDNIEYKKLDKRPAHSNDVLKINEGKKSWVLARAHWKRKVSEYCNQNNIKIPRIRPIN